jgi:CBS domain-containing protein
MKAKDLMIPLYEHLTPDTSLKDAVRLLRDARRGEEKVGVKGLPVLDSQTRLVGMLTMHDVLRAVYPAYLAMMNLGDFTWEGMIDSLAKQAGDRPVSAFMTNVVVTVRETDPLMECIDHMLKSRIKRVPVINAAGAVVGMLYERDIFFAVAKKMLDEPNGGVL